MGNSFSNTPATSAPAPTQPNAAAAYTPAPPSERSLKNAFTNLNSLKTKADQINTRVAAAEEKLKAMEAAKAAAMPAATTMMGGRRSGGKGRKGRKSRKNRK